MLDLLLPLGFSVLVVTLYLSERARFDRELAGERRRGDDLLDRLMARSHESYKALEAPLETVEAQAPPGRWVHDDTGLNVYWVPDEVTV